MCIRSNEQSVSFQRAERILIEFNYINLEIVIIPCINFIKLSYAT
jgi:hypothetical protein